MGIVGFVYVGSEEQYPATSVAGLQIDRYLGFGDVGVYPKPGARCQN